MTERPTPDPAGAADLPEVDAAFELASALLDGEGSDLERARADEPGVRDDVRSVAALSQRISEVPGAPTGLLGDHLAAALAAFDDEVAPVARLADRRSWWERVPLGAVAAAVVVVAVAGAIGLAASGDRSDDQDTATAPMEAETSGGDTGGEVAEDSAAAGTTSSGFEREAFPGYDELAASLVAGAGDGRTEAEEAPAPEASVSPSAGADAAPGAASAAGCDVVAVAGVDPATIEQIVPVVVEERLISAIVHTVDGERRLTAVDETRCAVDEHRPL